jgi:acyl-CoA reductase-like NAD-dependent aldehyde dehydrogenase
VQRIYAHEAIYDDLRDKVCVRARELRLGDPLQDETDVGPMIDAGAVERIEAWIESAVSDGAEVLVGGKSQGPIFEPTVMANVPSGSRLCTDEAFAPVVVLDRFHEFDDAVTSMNQSRFGLQAGIFTRDLNHVFRAFTDLEVGGVIVNDVPTFRADPMPYGGVKDSGLGREGVRFAIEELTETRLLVLRSGG